MAGLIDRENVSNHAAYGFETPKQPTEYTFIAFCYTECVCMCVFDDINKQHQRWKFTLYGMVSHSSIFFFCLQCGYSYSLYMYATCIYTPHTYIWETLYIKLIGMVATDKYIRLKRIARADCVLCVCPLGDFRINFSSLRLFQFWLLVHSASTHIWL